MDPYHFITITVLAFGAFLSGFWAIYCWKASERPIAIRVVGKALSLFLTPLSVFLYMKALVGIFSPLMTYLSINQAFMYYWYGLKSLIGVIGCLLTVVTLKYWNKNIPLEK